MKNGRWLLYCWLFELLPEVCDWIYPIIPHCRYSCLVCSHRPVFDTVDMLVVHRKGKRHLEGEILPMHLLSLCMKWHSGFKSSLVYSFIGMKWFYGKKNQLQREIDKRRHQDYVKAEDDRQVSECIFLSVYTVHTSILHFANLINFFSIITFLSYQIIIYITIWVKSLHKFSTVLVFDVSSGHTFACD